MAFNRFPQMRSDASLITISAALTASSYTRRLPTHPSRSAGASVLHACPRKLIPCLRGICFCRRPAGLADQLRRRVSRFKTLGKTLNKLFSPNLEKALTFLDDSLLPSTSNAVERANRRHRKMQKSIYRVRTREHISQRIAVDMQRDAHIDTQRQTTSTLHRTRSNKNHNTYEKRKIA